MSSAEPDLALKPEIQLSITLWLCSKVLHLVKLSVILSWRGTPEVLLFCNPSCSWRTEVMLTDDCHNAKGCFSFSLVRLFCSFSNPISHLLTTSAFITGHTTCDGNDLTLSCLPDLLHLHHVSPNLTKFHQLQLQWNHCRADTSLCQPPCFRRIDKGRFGMTAEEGTRRVVTGNTLWQPDPWRAGGKNGKMGGGRVLHYKKCHRESLVFYDGMMDGWTRRTGLDMCTLPPGRA